MSDLLTPEEYNTIAAGLILLSDASAARIFRIGCGEPRFGTRFSLRSNHIRLLPQTSSGDGRPVQVGRWVVILCHALHLLGTEFSATSPQAMQ